MGVGRLPAPPRKAGAFRDHNTVNVSISELFYEEFVVSFPGLSSRGYGKLFRDIYSHQPLLKHAILRSISFQFPTVEEFRERRR